MNCSKEEQDQASQNPRTITRKCSNKTTKRATNTHQLQEPVKRELCRLLKEDHIVKVGEIKEDVFLQPTVITVKKNRSVKIALDARELNKNVIKDKYPMPNLDNLMDMIAKQVGREKNRKDVLHITGPDVRLSTS